MPPDLSIVIVSWNTRELLRACLTSIFAHPPSSPFEVWVVDNASADGSAAMVRETFPDVRLIENAENVGFARANNQSIRESAGRYVMLLNGDTVVQPDSLYRLLQFMEQHPDTGILGASLLNRDGTLQRSPERFPSLFSEAAAAAGLNDRFPFSLLEERRPRKSEGEYREVERIPGAALVLRRAALDSVGLLDERFFLYSEEVDLELRLKRAGWKNRILLTAPIVHLGQQSTRQVAGRMKAQLFRSKVQYFAKHHGVFQAALLGRMFSTSVSARCLLYRLAGQRDLAALWSETQAQLNLPAPFPPGIQPSGVQVSIRQDG